ncbi:protein of unknown function DUF465 [Dinoroseobacter shibae DFL 12 = DSM 16493]|jgi:uncharacterized protein YdcH (DUF465 family)|uniref:DUF465 domain-containing protein n=1 Tax=Dinoroseobacter shibae (strain DSM 16493 / NCIMB 14021 / DFL 12) TaxID=398580 RepID=A8LQH4_DINSH|nr:MULTISPECIES: YdcH family protein [Dinoroseobacter]ABV92460.1 protein of unknown function DUF465 [Dinoroseobacter shibae DFL 12 = DSM 16493]MDD9718279.1 YdcH family protein [Dinoroseobacter sp. PD6]URF47405.1 YdcH family protein [Dinoroseobacter shibae]URF51716.1 YdcH family protein [Dinoroseobacter shibae]
MSHTPHELAEEFPDKVELIAQLRESNAHFAKLCAEYHEVNRAVHRAEARIEPVSDEAEEEMRRQRMRLKDEIYGMLTAAA